MSNESKTLKAHSVPLGEDKITDLDLSSIGSEVTETMITETLEFVNLPSNEKDDFEGKTINLLSHHSVTPSSFQRRVMLQPHVRLDPSIIEQVTVSNCNNLKD